MILGSVLSLAYQCISFVLSFCKYLSSIISMMMRFAIIATQGTNNTRENYRSTRRAQTSTKANMPDLAMLAKGKKKYRSLALGLGSLQNAMGSSVVHVPPCTKFHVHRPGSS